MEIDDGQLIEIVRQFSVLYDKSNKDYRNNEKKSNAWKTIGDIMNHSAAECETRWTTLRNIFTRESKKDKVVPSGSGGKVKPWIWLEEMRWLTEFVRRRKTKGNVAKPQSEEMELESQGNLWNSMTEIFRESEVETIEETEADENENPIGVDSELERENIPAKKMKTTNDDSSSSTPVRKSSSNLLPTMSTLRNERHERKKSSSQQSALLETMNSAWGKFDDVIKISSQKENHPDLLFGKMVGAELQSIENINTKFTVKQEIMKILHQVKMQ